MARQRASTTASPDKKLSFGTVSDKQKQFLEADTFFVGYGGAKGGGKSHIARVKAVGLCMNYPGIRVLMIRCHYPELEENLVRPILRWVPQEMYSYNGSSHLMTFENGSVIKFGHYDGDSAENEYQGVEYDVIFIDEATQLSERAFTYLQGCIRGVNDFPKRMYITCNPGGVGHRWVKRLFIDKVYKTNCDNPEENENPEDYTFIFATVEDNQWLLKSSPMYLKQLSNMPEDLRRAFRYGDWDAVGGNYFKEFSTHTHTVKPFKIPAHWPRYRSFDYGLDMLSVCWWAVDEDGRCWCYRHYEHKGLVISEAAKAIREHSLPSDGVPITYAPPDMWNRQKDTGRTMADVFTMNGVPITKSDNNRVQGHMLMKEMMSPIPLTDSTVIAAFNGNAPDKLPGLMFFNDLDGILEDIRDIQADEDNPNDCAKQPHEVTHAVDAVRAFCITRALTADKPTEAEPDDDDDEGMDYDSYMCGGAPSAEYLVG